MKSEALLNWAGVALRTTNFFHVYALDSMCGFEFEHNLKKLSFGIVIVHIPINDVESYRPLFRDLVVATERVRPGGVIHVGDPPSEPASALT
jgi:hypothetical protein